MEVHILILNALFLITAKGQQYDFAAEITRQCLVPDPVGLLDCVEDKVTLPYMTSWVDCTNSLGENVATSTDIINYRCKSVWEGKGVIPEVFYIKDCVIEKTGLPAKNVSAEVLGAYKECEKNPTETKRVRKPLPTGTINAASGKPQISSSVIYQSPIQQQGFQPVIQQQFAPLGYGKQVTPHASHQSAYDQYTSKEALYRPVKQLPAKHSPQYQQRRPIMQPVSNQMVYYPGTYQPTNQGQNFLQQTAAQNAKFYYAFSIAHPVKN